MEGFTPATPASMGPITIHTDTPSRDPAAVLSGEPLRRIIALHQRAEDIFSTVPSFEQVSEARTIKLQHEQRIADLMRPRSEGGFGQPESVGSVVAERRKLARAAAEVIRLSDLKQARTARWNAVAQLDRACHDWLFSGGVPGGCTVAPVEDAPITELLKKGEGIADAVERYRHRLRELSADLRRVRSSPWPASLAKQKAKEQIFALAAAAAPDCDRCIEHNLPVGFVTVLQSALVRGVETPAVAFSENVDAFGTMVWLFRDRMIAKISAALDEAAAGDSNALDERQRQEAEATIITDMLAAERSECSLVWNADSEGTVIDFRATTTPMAALGIRLVTVAPRVAASGTSVDHAYSLIGPR